MLNALSNRPIGLDCLMFNNTFKKIRSYRGGKFYWRGKPEYPEEIADSCWWHVNQFDSLYIIYQWADPYELNYLLGVVVVVAVCREATMTTFIFTLQLFSIQIVD